MTPDRASPYDVIVIGSGIGGLSAAALLSKLHQKRVLVLEQHFVAGGLTHEFQRHGYHFDVGLHYVGAMGPGEPGRKLFDFLTDGTLAWNKMPPLFEKFIYPDFSFDVPSDPKEYLRSLQEKFPGEKEALAKYFKDCLKAAVWYGVETMVETFPGLLRPLVALAARLGGGISRQTTKAYLDKNFKDDRLKSLLASQWGDYGLPPSQSAFGLHATIVEHYRKGGWYPVGGAVELARKITPVIEASGGAVKVSQRVEEILVEEGRAVGVRVRPSNSSKGLPVEYRAQAVISDAGSYVTYSRLLKSAPAAYQEELETLPKGLSAISLYLGFKESPTKLGFKGENYWVFEGEDHESPNPELEKSGSYYLSFPSLKDPQSTGHTAELIVFCEYDFFKKWSGQSWKRRDKDYYELKDRLTEHFLDLLDKRFPGFRNLVGYKELATPLTVEYFQQTPQGSFYGIPGTPSRAGKPWARVTTPVKGLYLTGADVFSLGIMGAAMGGVKTAGMMSGPFGFLKVMEKIFRKKPLLVEVKPLRG
ncbi:MAG TPA: NAD(P)/FAD-dependent oxidoreductase [bacterium]|jgi:all-trans-retinol 13,14-reductase|nr:NAD(P)/FAD-dependent oxidoreductase [bacterium]